MRKNIVIVSISIIISFLTSQILLAQTDSISTDTLVRLNTGIYANFNEFKNNNPSIKVEIILSEHARYVGYVDSTGATIRPKRKDVWGFCINGAVYYRVSNYVIRFRRLGSIIHFVDEKNDYAPFGKSKGLVRPNTTAQYLLDFETGEVARYSLQNAVKLLSRDPELFEELNALGNIYEMERQMFVFIGRFNERNPISFPRNGEKEINSNP